MKKRELLKQLHNLRNEIKPDLQWQKANREILLSQIKFQTTLDFSFGYKILFKNLFITVYKPLGGLILIFGVFFGVWIATVGAAKNSLPGDFLYGFKLTTERMKVNLTLNEEKKTNLEIAFAERRLEEIKKTFEKDGSGQAKDKLNITLKKYQESINNVKSNLSKLEITDKQVALKVADLVDQKTKEYIGIIKDQQGITPELALSKETKQAIYLSKSTGAKALSLIIKEFESGEGDLIIDQVKEKINARIIDLEKDLISAKSDISLILYNKKLAEEAIAKSLEEKKAQEAAEVEQKENEANNVPVAENIENINNDQTSSAEASAGSSEAKVTDDINIQENSETVEVLPSIEEIKDKPKDIEALIAKAKDYLKNNSVSQAFELVRQAEDLMTLVDKVIDANNQYLDI